MRARLLLASSLVLAFGTVALAAGADQAADSRNPARSPFAFGFQTSGVANGISLKFKASDTLRLQTIAWMTPSFSPDGSIDYSLGVRALKDLGFTGSVSRYAGVGVGMGRGFSFGLGAQAFIGLEVPWSIFSTTALNTSLEVGMGGQASSGRFQPKTTINFGVHYNF